MTAGFNLPDDFSQRSFDRYWSDKLDYCTDCQSEPCRCDALDLEDGYMDPDDTEVDDKEVKETFE